MDKVKMALVQLQKHHFWVLRLLIVVTVLVVWSLASADVEDRTGVRGRASRSRRRPATSGGPGGDQSAERRRHPRDRRTDQRDAGR